MLVCPYLTDNTCSIASELASMPCTVTQAACDKCSTLVDSRQPNRVTAGIALMKMKQHNKQPTTKIQQLLDITLKEPLNNPGTCLQQLFFELRVNDSEDCGCSEYASLMNSWGTAGCIDRKEEIIKHLTTQKPTLFTILKIAIGGYLTVEQLVDEAIYRSSVINK